MKHEIPPQGCFEPREAPYEYEVSLVKTSYIVTKVRAFSIEDAFIQVHEAHSPDDIEIHGIHLIQPAEIEEAEAEELGMPVIDLENAVETGKHCPCGGKEMVSNSVEYCDTCTTFVPIR
jgi:hypothetical protein